MNVFENEKLVSSHFESAHELLSFDFGSTKHGNRGKNEYLKGGYNTYGGKWLGNTNKDHDDVVRKAMIGDADLLSNLEDKVRRLEELEANARDSIQQVQQIKRVRRFADQGDELDIEKVYNGQLDTAWSKTERIEVDAKHKLITIFIQNGGTARKNAVESFWRSAIAIVLCKKLLAAGKSVKIIVGNYSSGVFTNCNKPHTSSIVIKNYNERLPYERLAAMTHLGFYRTFGFASKFITDYNPCGTLGSTQRISGENMLPVNLQDEIKKGHTKAVIIPELYHEHSAIQVLKDAYEQLA